MLVAPRSRKRGLTARLCRVRDEPHAGDFALDGLQRGSLRTAWSCSALTLATVIGSLRRSVASATPVTTTSSSRNGSDASWEVLLLLAG